MISISLLVIAICLIIAGVFNALMDLSSENHFNKKWWDKDKSWKNKWKLDSYGNLIAPPTKYWWYFGLYKPTYQERFIYSSTILVFLTDGWHLFQFVFFTCWQLAVSVMFLQYWWVVFIGSKIIFSLTFQLVYGVIKNKR